jgi:hypothetical protein
VTAAVRRSIADDKYPLSPRLAPLKSALAKLDPASAPKPRLERPPLPEAHTPPRAADLIDWHPRIRREPDPRQLDLALCPVERSLQRRRDGVTCYAWPRRLQPQ